MGIKEVSFLGRRMEISDQLPLYVSILEQFEGYSNELYAIVINQAKKGDYAGHVEQDFVVWKRPIEAIARKVVSSATAFGVYDLTVADLVLYNPGVSQLNNVCKDTMMQLIKSMSDSFESWVNGVERAERHATSNITGSGVSIWTNSLSSVLIYSLLETSTVRRQCNEADKEFRLAVEELNRRSNDADERNKTRILTQTYYPGCNAAIPAIISDMLKKYLSKIGSSGRFNYAEVANYNMVASSEVLNNLDFVSNKEEVLVRAFERCPYNPDIYKKLIDLGLVNFETFEIAKYLSQSSILLPYIEDLVSRRISKGQDTSTPIKIMAFYEGIDEKGVYRQIYSKPLLSATQKYGEVVRAIRDERSCKNWITNNIGARTSDVINVKTQIPYIVQNKVGGILNKNTYDKLKQYNLLDEQMYNMTGNPQADFNTIIYDLCNKLSSRIAEIIDNTEKRVSYLRREIDGLTNELTIKKQEYESLEQQLQLGIEALKAERNACGVFAISKKKDLDFSIERARIEMNRELNSKKGEIDSVINRIESTNNAIESAICI